MYYCVFYYAPQDKLTEMYAYLFCLFHAQDAVELSLFIIYFNIFLVHLGKKLLYNILFKWRWMLEAEKKTKKQKKKPHAIHLCPTMLVRMRDKQYLRAQQCRPGSKWKPHHHDKHADVIDLLLHSCSLVALGDGAKMRLNQDTGNL